MKEINLQNSNKTLKQLLEGRKLILASSSPRRKEILEKEGIEFEIKFPSDIVEETSNSDPVEHVLILSRKKAESVSDRTDGGIILGADTVVVLNGVILGKPQNSKEAFGMLRKLSGRSHRVYTGITLWNKYNGKIISDYDCTEVRFNRLEDQKIASYIDTGEPMDKAGAYGIQGMGSFLVESINGNLDNVIGLPTGKLKEMLINII
ncbi:MAG: Maf family protein [Candidatus Zixiibacteriota bacterium]